LNRPYHLAHGAADVHPGPLGARSRLARATAQPAGARQLVGEHLHLLAQPCRAADVVELLGLLELVAQLAEPRPVGAARVAIEHLTGTAGAQALGAAELERIKLQAGMPEQLEQV